MRSGHAVGLAFVAMLLSPGALLLAEESAPAATDPEVTVTAPRGVTIPGARPLLELSTSELESYGTDTLGDLVDALKPLTHSSRGDGMPVVLINGHLAGLAEYATFPSDAVERVDLLPETVALQYGYSADQRVLNVVLRRQYRAVTAQVSEGGATEGGDRTTQLGASLVNLSDERRVTMLGSFQNNAELLESDRGIDQPESPYRTLQPDKGEGKVAATVSGSILGVSASLEGSFDHVSTTSLQGSSEVADITTPLEQTGNQNTEHLGLELIGQLGRFVWGATGSYSRLTTESSGATGVDAAGSLTFDRTNSALDSGNLQLSLSGRIAMLPAGAVIANAEVGFGYQSYSSEDAYPGATIARNNLKRSDWSASLNANLPLTRHDTGVGTRFGDLSVTVNASFDGISDFGALLSPSAGLEWSPRKRVYFNATFTDHKMPPTVQQVLSPATVTPNVEMFDFVTGQTVFVTSVTGGARNLRATDDRVTGMGVSLGPFLSKTTLSVHYEQHSAFNAIGTLPPLTLIVEQAFPERFTRNAEGDLVAVDNRSVNLMRQNLNELKWGLDAWFPFGAAMEGGSSNRVEFSAFDTWVLKDDILIREGLPRLSSLNGAPSSSAGGQPRHQIEWSALIYWGGWGAAFSGTCHSATQVNGGDLVTPEALRFSALNTANLRLFADLDRLPATHDQSWAHGMRIALQVLNLFDRRSAVEDSAGFTPTAFAPGYVDPIGRTVGFTVRKVFH